MLRRRPRTGRTSAMAAIFTVYVVVIVAGIVLYGVIGLAHL